MSKAFTRELDDVPERTVRSRRASGLPPGATNYMTAEGARRLRAELDALLEGGPAVRRGRLTEVQRRLRTASVVARPEDAPAEVRFGATVTVRSSGGEVAYRIVGVDETDLDARWVSWLSPLAKALLHNVRGAHVRIPTDAGEEDAEIVAVDYE